MSASQVEKAGLKIETKDPTGTLIEPIDPATGLKRPAVPLFPDPHFDHNPGKAYYGNLVSYYYDKGQKHGKFTALLPLKTFEDYKRPPASEMPSNDNTDKVLPSYNDLKKKMSKKEIEEFYKEEFIKSIGGENIIIEDPSGQKNLLSTFLLDHLKITSGSIRYIPYLKDIVENPIEIWLTPMKNEATGKVALRKRLFYIIEDKKKKPLLLVLEMQNGIMTGWTMHRKRSLKRLDELRKGILLYPKK